MREGVIPDIYVQSQKYWSSYKDEVKSMWQNGIGHIDMVALQIRRGDYTNNPFYLDLTETDYYRRAIAMFPDDKFLVFCHDNQDTIKDIEDKEWCRKFLDELIPGRYEMNVPVSEVDDLNKFASCNGKIIANSTFGWWAGFLGEGKVVAPQKWFSDSIQRCELPQEFIQL